MKQGSPCIEHAPLLRQPYPPRDMLLCLQAVASATGNPTEAAGAEADVAMESENSPLKAENKDEVRQ